MKSSFCDPNSVVSVDARSLFDALCSDQCSGDDERSAFKIAIVKGSLSIVGGHNFNAGDA